MNTATVITLCPKVEGPAAKEIIEAFAASCRDVRCTVSLRELQDKFDWADKVYLVQLSINGQRIAEVEVVP